MYTLRPYQQEAADKAVSFFNDRKARYNALEMLATASGKSLIISEIASRLDGNTLVFCPQKEILQQNYEKYLSYGLNDAGIYSASFGRKDICHVTFATIKSAINHKELFSSFKNIIVDEAHQVCSSKGQYKDFFASLPCKVLGLTATPYRLTSQQGIMVGDEFKPNGTFNRIQYFTRGGFKPRPGVEPCTKANLKLLTRTIPRIFSKIIYYVQTSDLVNGGYLTKPRYFQMVPNGWNEAELKVNSTGFDYTDDSVKSQYDKVDFTACLASLVPLAIVSMACCAMSHLSVLMLYSGRTPSFRSVYIIGLIASIVVLSAVTLLTFSSMLSPIKWFSAFSNSVSILFVIIFLYAFNAFFLKRGVSPLVIIVINLL